MGIKNKKDFSIIIKMILILLVIVALSIQASTKQAILTNSQDLGNQKIGWGIKRNNNHEQPDLGNENKKMIDQYEGIAMGNAETKNIYITFDNGYEAGYTSKILDILKENEVQATFFITAHYLNTASDLVERMINEGHIVGNHTVNHKSMPSISNEEIGKEIMQLHQAVYEKFNYNMKYIRPPKGEFNERTLEKTLQLGYKTVMWSFAYVDWDENKQPTIEKAKEMIVNNFHNGEVMLLHANSKTNSEVLDIIIKEGKNQGYEFKSLSEFI